MTLNLPRGIDPLTLPDITFQKPRVFLSDGFRLAAGKTNVNGQLAPVVWRANNPSHLHFPNYNPAAELNGHAILESTPPLGNINVLSFESSTGIKNYLKNPNGENFALLEYPLEESAKFYFLSLPKGFTYKHEEEFVENILIDLTQGQDLDPLQNLETKLLFALKNGWLGDVSGLNEGKLTLLYQKLLSIFSLNQSYGLYDINKKLFFERLVNPVPTPMLELCLKYNLKLSQALTRFYHSVNRINFLLKSSNIKFTIELQMPQISIIDHDKNSPLDLRLPKEPTYVRFMSDTQR